MERMFRFDTSCTSCMIFFSLFSSSSFLLRSSSYDCCSSAVAPGPAPSVPSCGALAAADEAVLSCSISASNRRTFCSVSALASRFSRSVAFRPSDCFSFASSSICRCSASF
uniref:Uncharacterized protein n=1 Tax=Anopheles quadriannulatus TaxID=34691 RepID=A0A182XQM7_ANOQN